MMMNAGFSAWNPMTRPAAVRRASQSAAPAVPQFGNNQKVFVIEPPFETGGFLGKDAGQAQLNKVINPQNSPDLRLTVIPNKTQLKKIWKLLGQPAKSIPTVNFEVHSVVLISQQTVFEAKSLDRKSFTAPFTTLQAPRAARTFEVEMNTGPYGRPAQGTVWYLGVIEKAHLDTPPQIKVSPSTKPVYFP